MGTRAAAGTGPARTGRSQGTWAHPWTPARGKDPGTGVRTPTQTGTSRGSAGRRGTRRKRVQRRTGSRRRRRRESGTEARRRKKIKLKRRNRSERENGTNTTTIQDQRKGGTRQSPGMSTGIQREEKSEGEFLYGDSS